MRKEDGPEAIFSGLDTGESAVVDGVIYPKWIIDSARILMEEVGVTWNDAIIEVVDFDEACAALRKLITIQA